MNDLGSKEWKLSDTGLHKRALNYIWNSIKSFEASISKKGPSITAINACESVTNLKYKF